MSYAHRLAFPILVLLVTAFLSLPMLIWSLPSEADQLTLTWTDNSTNESGFAVERATGQAGTFAQVGTVAAKVTSYTDSTVASATTYCYRVRAFNNAGTSPYSNQACGTAAAPSPTATTPPAPTPTASAPAPTPTANTPDAGGWTFCANEGLLCNTGASQAEVRFGANGVFTAPKLYSTSLADMNLWCNTAEFGDPLPGVLKHCERRNLVTASSPNPPPPTTTTPPATTTPPPTATTPPATTPPPTTPPPTATTPPATTPPPTATTPPPLTTPTVTSTPVDPGPSSLPSPTDLKARVRRHWVVLRWDDNSIGERGFVIERALGAADFRPVGLMGRGQTSYIELVAPDGRYRYRVRTLGQAGQLSDPSNTVDVVID